MRFPFIDQTKDKLKKNKRINEKNIEIYIKEMHENYSKIGEAQPGNRLGFFHV